MKSSRKSLKKSGFLKKVMTQEILENSPIQNIHIPQRRLLGEALNTSEDKEKSLLEWLKDILVFFPKCEKALNLFMERKRADFQDFVSCLVLIF